MVRHERCPFTVQGVRQFATNVVQMRNVTGSIVYIVLFAFGKKRVTQSNSLLPMELSFRFEKKKRKKRRKKKEEEKKKMIIEEEERRKKMMMMM